LFAAVACLAAFARDSDRTIAQFAHTAWGAKEGAPTRIFAIKQTNDGYLWLGSIDGLFRFDGITFERYKPQTGPALPAGGVRSLLALPNQDLWIGFRSGAISHLSNGQAQNYTKRDGVPTGSVLCLAQSRDGTIWAGTTTGLARFDGNRWELVGQDWKFPGKSASALFLDHNGTLWVSTESTLVFLPAGARTFQSSSVHLFSAVPEIHEAPNGKLWMAETARSVRPVPLGSKLLPSDETEVIVGSQGFLFTRDGDLWITTLGDGIRRIHSPEKLQGKPDKRSLSIDTYTSKAGLTDNLALSILQDLEGNIWVGTNIGLDRFHEGSLVPIISSIERHDIDMVQGDDGDIWIVSNEGLGRVHESSIYPVTIPCPVNGAYRDPSGIIWWICTDALVRYENGHFSRSPLPKRLAIPFLNHVNATEDRSGMLWVAMGREGLFEWSHGVWSRFSTPPELAKLSPTTAFTDDLGRVWFGYEGGTAIYLNAGKIQVVSTQQDAPVGDVKSIQGRNRHVWIGGESGLAVFDGVRFRVTVPADAATFGAVSGVEETADGSLWFRERRGVIHINPGEVRKFLETPSYPVHYEIFDSLDGLPGQLEDFGQKEILDAKGRIWFAATNGIAWLDPATVPKNVPPRVSIRSVISDDTRFAALSNLLLPPRTRNLQVDYGALTVSAPERVGYRYELEGADKDWNEAGSRREAFYANLSPGKYRFHVNARREGGEWSGDAVLDFRIAPAWFQTIWFRAFCTAVFLLLLWTLYQLRLKQLERQFQMALEARVDERTRIARELHDTLLQSFQGITLLFQRARNLLPERAPEAIKTLDKALDGAEQAIVEGRDAIHDLRSPAPAAKVLAEEITAFGQELVAKDTDEKKPVQFRLVVEGSARALSPSAHTDIFRIAREAIRNAFVHSQGRLIETEIAYTENLFRMRIRDDGKGIDPELEAQADRTGHWGLKGMRERAEHLGGELEVWSEPGAGTEIELRVPSSIAYEPVPSRNSSWLFWSRKGNP
jgi:signal transduction histidine kinase/ligand-binding sensor domain-containing protein